MTKSRRRRRGLSIAESILLWGIAITVGVLLSGFLYFRAKYTQSDQTFLRSHLLSLEQGTFEYEIARLFLSDEEWENTVEPEEETIVNLNDDDVPKTYLSQTAKVNDPDTNGDGIYIEHIYGDTFEGYMMIVEDPSDVYITINPYMNSGGAGPLLDEYIEMEGADGGINAGGFIDYDGNGDGSIPAGIVIIDGKLISGGAAQPIVGLTKDHKLVCTTCTGEQALAMGVVEAVTFGPTLIEDGQEVYIPADSLNMLNPRTAIGQKEDGTMLLLVVDGRGPTSWGAKYEDLVEIFREYGAVNAGNLDGGNSSVMYYNGDYVHYPVAMYNSRNLPSAILVKGDRVNE